MAPGVLHFCGPGSAMSGNLRIQSDQSKERLVPRQRTADSGQRTGIWATRSVSRAQINCPDCAKSWQVLRQPFGKTPDRRWRAAAIF